jgi:hypothetical protein
MDKPMAAICISLGLGIVSGILTLIFIVMDLFGK